MVDKKFILNADDFGLTQAHNQAVLEGYVNGFLTSASICVNGSAYENVIHDILPDCSNLGLGVHLNIMVGKPLTHCPKLTNTDGIFNSGYLHLFFNRKNKTLLTQIENEFRMQIEKALQEIKIDHLDSYAHIHSIPEIFEITCKLAQEYGIKYVRTQFEEFYFIPKFSKHLNFKYLNNLLKVMLLQNFTIQNRELLKKYQLKTNDYILGIGYNEMLDSEAIEYGLEGFEQDCILEAIIHPCKYSSPQKKDSHTIEFAITQDLKLKDKISRLGFNITNYKNLD